MQSKKFSVFKGLQENIDFGDKSPEYAESMSNLDVDNPYGQLTKRDGYQKKYSTTFTDIISMYEYKFPRTSEEVTLINDNGTIRRYTVSGGVWANQTLPTGSTLESGFKNEYFGYNDAILVTTGNGSTNHVLWHGETYRDTSVNDGLFNNQESDSGTFRWLRAQLIPENGAFNNIHNICYIDSHYYISIGSHHYADGGQPGLPSKFIEKRNSDFQLVEKLEVNNLSETPISNNARVSLCADDTYIYAGIEDDLYIIDPDNWSTEEKVTLSSSDIVAIAQDSTHLYVSTKDHLYRRLKSDLTAVDDTAVTVGDSYGLDVPASGNYFYFMYQNGNDHIMQQRNKSDLSVNASNTLFTDADTKVSYIAVSDDGLSVYAVRTDTDTLGIGYLYTVTISGFTDIGSAYNIRNFIRVSGTTLRGIKEAGIFNISTQALIYPDILNMRIFSSGSTGMTSGCYFYKYSIVDTDGVEHILSDPVMVSHQTTFELHNIWVCFNKDYITAGYAYRIKYINLYRAYSSLYDTDIPETDYRLLEQIDINSAKWADASYYHGSGLDYYIYKIYDKILEEDMSDVTYLENAGISDEVRPRYVNAKHLLWLDHQLHLANFYCDGVVHASLVVRSPVDAPSAIALYDYYSFGYDGFEILALTEAYGRSVIFKQHRFGIFYNGTLEYEKNMGVEIGSAIAKLNNDIFIGNPEGIFLIRGQDILKIGEPIKESYAGLTDYDELVLFAMPGKERLLITIPDETTFVYNYRYKTWVEYSSSFTFKHYMINSDGEYIGAGDPLAGGNEYIWKFSAGNDGRETNGTGGTDLTISYDSGLIKLTDETDMHVTLMKFNYRALWALVIGESMDLDIYRYHRTGRTAVYNSTILPPSGSYIGYRQVYLDGGWGESFSWHLSGDVTAFQWNEIAFVFDKLGRMSA